MAFGNMNQGYPAPFALDGRFDKLAATVKPLEETAQRAIKKTRDASLDFMEANAKPAKKPLQLAQGIAPALGAGKAATVPKPNTPPFDDALINSYRRAIYNGTEPVPAIMPPMTPQQNPGRTLPWWTPGSLNPPPPQPKTLPLPPQMTNWDQLTYGGNRPQMVPPAGLASLDNPYHRMARRFFS